MADGLERLLEYLVGREIVGQEEKNVQLNVGPREPGETVAADRRIVHERDRHRVTELGPAFAEGLRRAYDARRAGRPELILDDRHNDENAIADALVQFLVRPDLAASHSEQTEPNHYRYHFTIDWPQLATLAAEAGIDLDQELTRG